LAHGSSREVPEKQNYAEGRGPFLVLLGYLIIISSHTPSRPTSHFGEEKNHDEFAHTHGLLSSWAISKLFSMASRSHPALWSRNGGMVDLLRRLLH